MFVASIIRNRLCIIYVFFDHFLQKFHFYWKLFSDCCDKFVYPGSIVYLSCFLSFSQEALLDFLTSKCHYFWGLLNFEVLKSILFPCEEIFLQVSAMWGILLWISRHYVERLKKLTLSYIFIKILIIFLDIFVSNLFWKEYGNNYLHLYTLSAHTFCWYYYTLRDRGVISCISFRILYIHIQVYTWSRIFQKKVRKIENCGILLQVFEGCNI